MRESKEAILKIRFVKFWVDKENECDTKRGEEISSVIRDYTHDEMYDLIKEWVDEYIKSGLKNDKKFFNDKLNELVDTTLEQEARWR